MEVVGYICAGLMLCCGTYAVMNRSILRSAIGLALSSAALAALLYALGAKLAAVVELSVCSGLVTVIFIAGISLSHSPKVALQQEYRDRERSRALPFLLIGVGAGLVALALALGYESPGIAAELDMRVQEALWNTRQADIWGQIAAILCGGVAVAVLFREERREEK